MPKAGRDYASQRNSDFGPGKHNQVSVLSPYIRHRLISEEEVVRETLKRHSFKASEKFLQEVFWRSYFKGWLQQHPDVWLWYKEDLKIASEDMQTNPSLKQLYEEAISGRTGIDCFDVWTNELTETGYLHNHARMWFASIWIFTLGLPWVLGADFFYRHLLDGDPASNTCSWRWVGGLHTKGKHYVARASNIEKFTHGRFNPIGQLNENPQPLSDDRRIELRASSALSKSATKDATDKSHILVVTEEDCLPETLPFKHLPSAVIGVNLSNLRSSLEINHLVHEFSQSAVEDTLQRCRQAFDCETLLATSDDFQKTLLQATESTGTTEIKSAFLPVGHGADWMEEINRVLRKQGFSLDSIVRPYDQACWPHATRGFFKLKEKIPMILTRLALA